MKLHVVKNNGDSEFIDDVKLVHVDKIFTCKEYENHVQLWSNSLQHKTYQEGGKVFINQIYD